MACTSALSLPLPAFAQTCEGPPGRSGLDQYCDTIPGAGGDRDPSNPDRVTPGVPDSTTRQLQAAGPDGRALNRFASGAEKRGPKPRRVHAGSDLGQAGSRSDNALDGVRSAVRSGATSGDGFVWLLLVVALALGGGAWVRFRRTGTELPPRP